MSTDKDKVTPAWRDLERQVATHYEALGYNVTHNSEVLGHQIDLLATKYIDGGTAITVMIEVKHRTDSPIGINDVTNFQATARHLLTEFRISNAVMVTNADYTPKARAPFENAPNIQLTTLSRLEQDIFGYSDSLLKIQHDYERGPDFGTYIRLPAKPTNGPETTDLVNYCLRWGEGDDPLLVMLGDFGSGKTTAMMRIRYEQSLARIRNQHHRYPVLLRLRSFRHFPDLWSFISDSLRNNQYVSPSQETFFAHLKQGRLLILLDGFDEIHTGASAIERGLYLSKLSPLFTTLSPCIISSRPTYFDSFEDLTRAFRENDHPKAVVQRVDSSALDLDAMLRKLDLPTRRKFSEKHLGNAVAIKQWDETQILAFLGKHAEGLKLSTGRNVREIKAFLDKIYDLEDLMTRPLLLSMVVQTILAGKVDITDDAAVLGPSSLYELYTQLCVERDRNKTSRLSADERLAASRALAMMMLKKGSIELTADEVRAGIQGSGVGRRKASKAKLSNDALNEVLVDIRTNAFLSLAEDGSLRFAHKSFYEFFVAQYIMMGVAGTQPSLQVHATTPLSREILYFLGSYGRDNDEFGRLLVTTLRSQAVASPIYNLVARIIVASAVLLSKVPSLSGVVGAVDVRRAEIIGARLKECRLAEVSFRRVRGTRWTFDQVAMLGGEIHDCHFHDCDLDLDVEAGSLTSVRFDKGRLALRGTSWKIEASGLDQLDLVLAGQGRAIDCTVSNSQVTLGPDLWLGSGTRLNIRKSFIRGCRAERWADYLGQIALEQCELAGVWLDPADLIAASETVPTLHHLRMRECSGVVITFDYSGSANAVAIDAFKRRNPHVFVADDMVLRRELEIEARSDKGKSIPTSGEPILLERLRERIAGVHWRKEAARGPLSKYLQGS